MPKSWPFKDPLEVLDYGFDWGPRMAAGDAIATFVATKLSGSVVVDSYNKTVNSTVTTTWLSGGVVGEDSFVRLLITTTQNRTLEETIKIKTKDR